MVAVPRMHSRSNMDLHTYVRGVVIVAMALASSSAAADPTIFPVNVLRDHSVQVDYATRSRKEVVAVLNDLGLPATRSIDLTITSLRPTQVRLTLDRPLQPPSFRYLVFVPGRLTRHIRVPLSAFDPDPLVASRVTTSTGALRIIDSPGMLRSSLENTLSVGPLKLLTDEVALGDDEVPPAEAPADESFHRILGGWLGKASGGALGIPLEGDPEPSWNYLPRFRQGLPGFVWGLGADDDTTFLVQHLLARRERGPAVTSRDLINSWSTTFAPEFLWRTERHSLANLARGVAPEKCGDSPVRESLCARIRADLWGFLSLGDPAGALAMVERDAPLSNAGDGVWDARFAAVAISLASRSTSMESLLESTLAALPSGGESYKTIIRSCLADFRAGRSLQAAYDRHRLENFEPLKAVHGADTWVMARPNAGLVALSLLYGRGQFADSVALAASLGWDTDCNAATVGSILGVRLTDSGIPPSFRDRLHDRLRVAIAGREHWSLRRLAFMTWEATKGRPAHAGSQ